MKQRNFFAALCGLPALIMGRSIPSTWVTPDGPFTKFKIANPRSILDDEWQCTPAPINEWVWVVCAGRYILIARLCNDNEWEQLNKIRGWAMHTVTHWQRITDFTLTRTIPRPPYPFKKKMTWDDEDECNFRRVNPKGISPRQYEEFQSYCLANDIFPSLVPDYNIIEQNKWMKKCHC